MLKERRTDWLNGSEKITLEGDIIYKNEHIEIIKLEVIGFYEVYVDGSFYVSTKSEDVIKGVITELTYKEGITKDEMCRIIESKTNNSRKNTILDR